jgi:UDP-glucuronate 4-epimerase
MIEKHFQTTNILITGVAGFIGFHLSKRLLACGATVIGFDNLNKFYDVDLKASRLDILKKEEKFTFINGDLMNNNEIERLFKDYRPKIVVNLAAQARARYSVENPRIYMENNVIGFFNILECCRCYPVEHLLYASSSSVYGNQEKIPFSTRDSADCPISFYAATKKSNELMAHTYSHLYGIPTTGLRFFTVYGPYGRSDMAYFDFTRKIFNDETIKVFNNGNMYRDFTYIDDVVLGIENILSCPPKAQYKIYNIGNHKPECLIRFIEILENIIGKKAKKEFLPMQSGDVYQTCADISDFASDFDFRPNTPIEEGLRIFVNWYKKYYSV